MARRARLSLLCCVVVLICMQVAGCATTPSNFNSVVLSPSARKVTAGGTVTITAAVPKDTTNAGVTWVFTPGAGAPANPGTFSSTTSKATYTAPNSVTSGFTVTITATSIAFTNETASVTISVEPPQPLKVTTASLPDGTLNVAYPATNLQASGGVAPYSWQVTVGSLPAGLSLASDGAITGAPTATGTSNFTVKVTDSESPAMTATANLSIVVANLLNGHYAFELSGFNSHGAVAIAGSFTADGAGNITNGVEDVNSIQGPPANHTFTGNYTLTSDNRGQLVFSSLSGSPTFDFALDATGAHGRLVEFDATGIRGSGELVQQNVSSCAAGTLSGTNGTDYAFGVTGEATSLGGGTAGPLVIAGRFTAEVPPNSNTPGNIDTGEADANIPQGTSVNPMTLSGTFQTTSQAARCTMSIQPGTLPTATYSVYPVLESSGIVTEAFIVETDTVSATTPNLTVGKMYHQVGYPFPGNAEGSLTGASVGAVRGNFTSNGTTFIPDVAIARLTWSAGVTFSISVVENQGGTTGAGGPFNANFQQADSFGRLATNLVSPLGPTFYVVAPNEVLLFGEDVNEPLLGLLEPQSGAPFSGASALNGTFIEGTSFPSSSGAPDFSGTVTLANTTTTSGTVAGTQDTSTSSANTSAQAVTGTYSGFVAATGAGNLTLTAPAAFTGSFFAVSPTKIVMVSTTAADTNPVIVILGE